MVPGLSVDEKTVSRLIQFSEMTPSAISVQELINHGKRGAVEESFTFLQKELPVRLANMIMELQYMPNRLVVQPLFQKIVRQYLTSFKAGHRNFYFV